LHCHAFFKFIISEMLLVSLHRTLSC